LRVLGVSVITDLGLPDALEPASLARIIAVANRAEPHLTALLRGVLRRVAAA
jgi:purine-nucleoside phosphorylase